MAKLICGVNEIALEDIEGKTINEAKRSYGQTLNIPRENCSVLVSGNEVTDMDSVINSDDEVEFVKESGEKGCIAA